jgi:hypothetical protein
VKDPEREDGDPDDDDDELDDLLREILTHG